MSKKIEKLINTMHNAWFRFTFYGDQKKDDKLALQLLSDVADAMDHGAQEVFDNCDDPAYTEDPLWNLISERYAKAPFDLHDAAGIVDAYVMHKYDKRHRSNIKTGVIRLIDILMRAPYPKNYLRVKFGKSPLYAAYSDRNFDKLMAGVIGKSLPDLVDAVLMEDKTGKYDNWFFDDADEGV